MRRRLPGLFRVLVSTFAALVLAAAAAPSRVDALVDCNDPALQGLKLPDPASPGDNGWTKAGDPLKGTPPNPMGSIPQLAKGDQSKGVAEGTAQLFTQQVGNVLCTYLRRERPNGSTLNGVLCFDTTDCSVCAWDKSTNPGAADPKDTLFSSMLFTSSYGTAGGIQDCSECHVNGPAMPMDALYEQKNLIDLMNKCVEVGGPKWVSAPAGWATQDLTNIVPAAGALAGCDGGGCHEQGFLKPQANQMRWCDFAGQAFQEGGSMFDQYSEEDCRDLMDALTCNPNECDSDAVPAVSGWGVVTLIAALLASASLLAVRRNPIRTR